MNRINAAETKNTLRGERSATKTVSKAGANRLPSDPTAGPVAEGRARLAGDVASGEVFRPHIDIEWPERPDEYRLVVDLMVRDVAWFAERLGEPVAHGLVEVRTAEPVANR